MFHPLDMYISKSYDVNNSWKKAAAMNDQQIAKLAVGTVKGGEDEEELLFVEGREEEEDAVKKEVVLSGESQGDSSSSSSSSVISYQISPKWKHVYKDENIFMCLAKCINPIGRNICEETTECTCPYQHCSITWCSWDVQVSRTQQEKHCGMVHPFTLMGSICREHMEILKLMTKWTMHFCIFESVPCKKTTSLSINTLTANVDYMSIYVTNPNDFPLELCMTQRYSVFGKKMEMDQKNLKSFNCFVTLAPKSVYAFQKNTLQYWSIRCLPPPHQSKSFPIITMGRIKKCLQEGFQDSRIAPLKMGTYKISGCS